FACRLIAVGEHDHGSVELDDGMDAANRERRRFIDRLELAAEIRARRDGSDEHIGQFHVNPENRSAIHFERRVEAWRRLAEKRPVLRILECYAFGGLELRGGLRECAI